MQILGLRPMTDLRLEINDPSITTANESASENTKEKEKEKGRGRENASGTWNVNETATDSENVIAIWTATGIDLT